MKIKKGDFVKVIIGKYKGKIGKVLKTFPDKNKVVVENVNIFKRHKKNRRNLVADSGVSGNIIEFNAPIDVSNVAFYDKDKKETCKLGYKFFNDEKWRINKKTLDKINIVKKKKTKIKEKIKEK